MLKLKVLSIVALGLLLAFSGCSTAPKSEAKREDLQMDAVDAIKQMKADDSSLDAFLSHSYGYVIFPHVGKGAYIVGGSYGRGIVYEQGMFIGYADISQATVGLQVGGQAFMELLAFESKRDLDRFTSGKLAISANLSAVILKTGAAASAKYTDGVACFVKPIGGAMVEASIGGQQFTFVPK
ncbi:MAG TPA: lipid-binding SYLF domain-containing protein [Tepidisphaeraceae bacterium]|nr:lipid-binding SYLF domain-containing protein [Tepidisphaeraceae bacterium]